MSYTLLFQEETYRAEYTVSENNRYSRFFQLITIIGDTTNGCEVVISKVGPSLLVHLNGVKVFYDAHTPKYMSVEQILDYIGFHAARESKVAL